MQNKWYKIEWKWKGGTEDDQIPQGNEEVGIDNKG